VSPQTVCPAGSEIAVKGWAQLQQLQQRRFPAITTQARICKKIRTLNKLAQETIMKI